MKNERINEERVKITQKRFMSRQKGISNKNVKLMPMLDQN